MKEKDYRRLNSLAVGESLKRPVAITKIEEKNKDDGKGVPYVPITYKDSSTSQKANYFQMPDGKPATKQSLEALGIREEKLVTVTLEKNNKGFINITNIDTNVDPDVKLEDFAQHVDGNTEEEFEKKMAAHFSFVGTITLEKFLEVFRENFMPENNILLRMKLDDWVWLKYHVKDSVYLNKTNDLKKYEFMFTKLKGIRHDAEPGVVVNFIKSIYALYQNRETLFEESLQTNVDLIFDAIYRYLKEGR